MTELLGLLTQLQQATKGNIMHIFLLGGCGGGGGCGCGCSDSGGCGSGCVCVCGSGVVASASASLCNGAMSTCANASSKAFAFHCDRHCDRHCDHPLSIGCWHDC